MEKTSQHSDPATQISHAEIDRIVAGTHHDPHSVLGAHEGPAGTVVAALRPLAASVAAVLPDGRRFPMEHVHQGVFTTMLPVSGVPDYRLAVAYPAPGADGTERNSAVYSMLAAEWPVHRRRLVARLAE